MKSLLQNLIPQQALFDAEKFIHGIHDCITEVLIGPVCINRSESSICTEFLDECPKRRYYSSGFATASSKVCKKAPEK